MRCLCHDCGALACWWLNAATHWPWGLPGPCAHGLGSPYQGHTRKRSQHILQRENQTGAQPLLKVSYLSNHSQSRKDFKRPCFWKHNARSTLQVVAAQHTW